MTSTKQTNPDLLKRYFDWLCAKMNVTTYSNYMYLPIFVSLFNIEFYGKIPNDDNRVKDGIELRNKFDRHIGGYYTKPEIWKIKKPCSVLEMLIALSERMAYVFYIDENHARHSEILFFEMIKNMGLSPNFLTSKNEMTIENFVRRDIAYNGDGGLFPLMNPEEDQREVEIWYQMQAYIKERTKLFRE